jgi:hypothetical protein
MNAVVDGSGEGGEESVVGVECEVDGDLRPWRDGACDLVGMTRVQRLETKPGTPFDS